MRNILVGFLVFWLAGCASMRTYEEPLKVSLLGIQPGEMTLLEQRYHVRMRVLNPNDAGIPVKGLSYSIEINQREFAYGVSNQVMAIPAFGEAVLDVEVVSSLLNVISQLQGMGDAPPDRLDYRLSGKLSLESGGRVPFDFSGTLDFRPKTGSGNET